MNPREVVTERLVLREPVPGDLQVVFDVHADPATKQFNPAGPHRSPAQSRRMLRRWLAHWRRFGFGYWSVATRRSPETVIGFGGLMFKDIGDRLRANLYFRFRPAAWGQGYATEMARAGRQLALEELALDEIVATVRPANEPSIRALERLGMTYVEDVRDRHGASRLYVLRADTT
jgi:ribosomal-protein-alanine N-acetyltransferase